MNATMQRLGIPEQFSTANGHIVLTKMIRPALVVTKTRTWNKLTKKYDVATTYSLKEEKMPLVGLRTDLLWNHLSTMINNIGFVPSEDGYSLTKPALNYTPEFGPQAGKEFWTSAQTITMERGIYKRTYDDPFMNIDETGAPHEGRLSMVTYQRDVFATRTVEGKVNKTYTRAELLSLGITTEQLAAMTYEQFDIRTPSEATSLLNVSTDLEELEEGTYMPVVYINGKDANTFDFRKLVGPSGQPTNDFIIRVLAYNDSTNADYPEPNYSGMGNFGKCLDLPFENEAPKPVRVTFGSNFAIENTEDELHIQFDENGRVSLISMMIEWKPLDGKKTYVEMFLNPRTGERFLDIFAAHNSFSE